jgi:hypothetical protein
MPFGAGGSKSGPYSKDIIRLPKFPLGYSGTFLCIVVTFSSRIVRPPGVPLQQIQFVVILMSSESGLLNLNYYYYYYYYYYYCHHHRHHHHHYHYYYYT